MKRSVTSHLELYLHGEADLILSVAVAGGADADESLTITSNGAPIEAHEVAGRHGTRLHRLLGPPGPMVIDYSADVVGLAAPIGTEELDIIEYRRPSRYCESDTLSPTARAEFGGLEGRELLAAVAT